MHLLRGTPYLPLVRCEANTLQRCSTALSIVLIILCLGGIACLVDAILLQDAVLQGGSALLIALAAFSLFNLHKGCFAYEGRRAQVKSLREENLRLKGATEALERQQVELEAAAAEFKEAGSQLCENLADIQSTLDDLQRVSALHEVTAMVNLFFASDLDHSGRLTGDEAPVFVAGLASLWELLPEFESDRLTKAIRTRGLGIHELAALLDGLTVGDADKCRKELESICPPAPKIHCQPRGLYFPTLLCQQQVRTASSSADIECGMMPEQVIPEIKEECQLYSEEENDDVTDQRIRLSTFCAFGPLYCRSIFHVISYTFMLATCTVLVLALSTWETLDIVLLIDVAFSGVLLLFANTLHKSSAFKKEIESLNDQNIGLEHIRDGLAASIAELERLVKSISFLQRKFQGSVTKAKQAVSGLGKRVEVATYESLIHLFTSVDADKDAELSAEEAERFLQQVELVFRSVPGFNVVEMRDALPGQRLHIGQLRTLLDNIQSLHTQQLLDNIDTC
eukprot:TRINITY_DN72082_c0_g1_i1.p1 TRINITY_DN72082_c0_g1~~TRINITY_DN72082_c0_g1_i1.p1  ORF type:complete len:510 (-),score=77.49 TRINITY_DN72082_c0_g1_i1:95-1624(-)